MSSSFQQNWIHSIRTSFAKVMAVQVLLLDLVRRWSGVSGPTGVSGPKDPESSVPCFSLFYAKVWCAPVVCPEVHRRWYGVSGPTGVSGPKDPESPALSASSTESPWGCRVSGMPESPAPRDRNLRPSRFVSCVVHLWCQSGRRPEPGRNLRPRPESPAHLHRSLRPAQAVTASFWGGYK